MAETWEQAIAYWLHKYGPEGAGPPPEHIVEALLALCGEELPEVAEDALHQRAEEIVVAYGMGWRRTNLGEEGWEGRWPRILDCMAGRVHGWMRAVFTWLYDSVELQGFAYNVPFPPRDEVCGEAWEIARHFWLGTCACERVRDPALVVADDVRKPRVRKPKPEEDAQEIGEGARCRRTHRLQAWNPCIPVGNATSRLFASDAS